MFERHLGPYPTPPTSNGADVRSLAFAGHDGPPTRSRHVS